MVGIHIHSIQFTLMVDDFGVKNVGHDYADYLIHTLLCQCYKFEEDRKGTLCCSITLKCDVLMPSYIDKI